jgi:hypothetical protein
MSQDITFNFDQRDSRINDILSLTGEAVLIPVPWRSKKPRIKEYPSFTLQTMKEPSYRAKLESGNLAVLLGKNSGGLCSIDIDDKAYIAEFDSLNPDLTNTLRTFGKRGCNIWVRHLGPYPGSTKMLKTKDGADWGEYRSNGITIIYGRHVTDTCDYTHNGKQVINYDFSKILWPSSINDPPCLKGSECTEETDATEATELPNEVRVCDWSGVRFTVTTEEEAVSLSLPTSSHQNHHGLLTLGRAVKTLEIQYGEFGLEKKDTIFDKWYAKAKEMNILRSDQNKDQYRTEFYDAYSRAKYPIGSVTIPKAWERAKNSPPPKKAMGIENQEHRLIASLCRELQTEVGDKPFYLSCRTVQKLLKHETHSTAASWLRALTGMKIIVPVEKATQKRAIRYRYLP